MIYLLPTGSDNMRGMSKDHFGVLRNLDSWEKTWGVLNGYRWAGDNGAFSKGFRPKLFFDWLNSMQEFKSTCLFIVIPDVVGNAIATLISFRYWAWRVKAMGFPVAFVAQDGQESLSFPPEFDWLFIGGTTEWKLGEGAITCINRAKALSKPIHVGRVNSKKRVKLFMLHGVDSVDGTHWIYEPDVARMEITGWMAHRPLFTLEDK